MRGRLNSLQRRVILLHLLAIMIAAAAVPLTNYLVINRSTDLFEARTLRDHAAAIASHLRQDPDGGWQLDLPPDMKTLYSHGLDGLSYQVVDGNRLIFGSLQGDAAVIPLMQGNLARISRNGATVYGVAVLQAGVWVRVAQNVQHPDVIFDDIVSDYLGRIGWFTIAILAVLLGIDIVIIRNAMRPVLRASSIASAIAPGRPDLRLPTANMPREVLPLITAVNEALGRLEKGITLQREFTADAAHELRTPLAVLRARIDTFPDQKLVAELRADLDVMGAVVTQLLDIAELENASIDPSAVVDLHAIGVDVVGMMAALAICRGRELALIGDGPVWVRGNAGMIFRAVRNIVENAIRHTDPGTTVDVEIGRTFVRVLDRGPGVPREHRADIFRRFWRTGRHLEGTGLGLAIVTRIAEIHGATVSVTDRPGGGAVFVIDFPVSNQES
jgi:signal transduction histidine kinase